MKLLSGVFYFQISIRAHSRKVKVVYALFCNQPLNVFAKGMCNFHKKLKIEAQFAISLQLDFIHVQCDLGGHMYSGSSSQHSLMLCCRWSKRCVVRFCASWDVRSSVAGHKLSLNINPLAISGHIEMSSRKLLPV